MRFALFGAGRVGLVHAENIVNHPDAELKYVFDINQEASGKITKTFGGIIAQNPDHIWDSDEIDAVLIASSTNTHVELLRGAIKSRKATFCEKPIDIDLKKAKEIEEEANLKDVPIFMAFRRRFVPEIQMIHQKIHQGSLGQVEVVHIIARDFQPPPISYVNVSGGFLCDKTIHYFDLICWLTGESPIEVYANGSCLIDQNIGRAGDVDTVFVILKMPSGALCQIQNSRRTNYGIDERYEVFGSLGMLQWNPLQEKTLSHINNTGIILNRVKENSKYIFQDSFAAELDEFINCVNAGKLLEPSLKDYLE